MIFFQVISNEKYHHPPINDFFFQVISNEKYHQPPINDFFFKLLVMKINITYR